MTTYAITDTKKRRTGIAPTYRQTTLFIFNLYCLVNDRSFFKSIRVFRGAEPPANSDHRLVVATAALRLFSLIEPPENLSSPSSTLHY